jgi:ferredoxin
MIVTYSKPYGIVKGMLKKRKKIGIVSCNSCARACETGRKEKMDELATRLRQDGYEVVGTELLAMACNIDAAKRPDYKGDMLAVLACDSGVLTLQSKFPSKMVVPALDTIGNRRKRRSRQHLPDEKILKPKNKKSLIS